VLADVAARLTLAERESRGLALADVEALDEAGLAGRWTRLVALSLAGGSTAPRRDGGRC
jgi:hypothetical protein